MFITTISDENIKIILTGLYSIIDKKATIAALADISITQDNGLLVLTSTDLNIEKKVRIKGQVHGDFGKGYTINAKQLLEFVKNATGDIRYHDNKIWLHNGIMAVSFIDGNIDCFPDFYTNERDQEINKIVENGAIFKNLFKTVKKIMPTDDVRYYLNGAFFEIDDNRIRITATDGHNLTHSQQTISSDTESSFILPRKSILQLDEAIKKDSTVKMTEFTNHVVFDIDSAIMRCKKIDSRFAQYTRVLKSNDEYPNSIKIVRKNLITSLKSVSMKQKKGNHDYVRVVVDNDLKLINTITENQNTAYYSEQKGDIDFIIDSKQLLNCLESSVSDSITLYFDDKNVTIKLDGNDIEAYVMQVKPGKS